MERIARTAMSNEQQPDSNPLEDLRRAAEYVRSQAGTQPEWIQRINRAAVEHAPVRAAKGPTVLTGNKRQRKKKRKKAERSLGGYGASLIHAEAVGALWHAPRSTRDTIEEGPSVGIYHAGEFHPEDKSC